MDWLEIGWSPLWDVILILFTMNLSRLFLRENRAFVKIFSNQISQFGLITHTKAVLGWDHNFIAVINRATGIHVPSSTLSSSSSSLSIIIRGSESWEKRLRRTAIKMLSCVKYRRSLVASIHLCKGNLLSFKESQEICSSLQTKKTNSSYYFEAVTKRVPAKKHCFIDSAVCLWIQRCLVVSCC